MRRKTDILSIAIIVLTLGLGVQSCSEDEFGEEIPGKEEILDQGQYMTARRVDNVMAAADNPEREAWFEVGTPYRLLAFTKPYISDKAENEAIPADNPRFNRVAQESETVNGQRYINIGPEAHKWLGFMALPTEAGGDDDLVSLDFYGFTYGKKQETITPDYIELDGIAGLTNPTTASLSTLKRTERVSADGTMLNDLMRGCRLNRNIYTVGYDATNSSSQSVIPFKHSFSKLQFMVVQQADETLDAAGNEVPMFDNLKVEGLKIVDTYGVGAVYVEDGKVELSGDKINRPLKFLDTFTGNVGLQQTDMGEMILFPSSGDALKNPDLADGYNVGLNINLSSTNKEDLQQFLSNTNSPPIITEIPATETTPATYKATIVKESIIDNFTNLPLQLKQGTIYRLIISFQKDAVRIITVIPQVEEWLPGEGTEADPWQDQPLGQPQMFDNIVWSDRNLGADHYDPFGDQFEKTLGYFYQSGRNIPYYPFYYDDGIPTDYTKDKYSHKIANEKTGWHDTKYRFYPIVDKRILNFLAPNDYWAMDKNNTPQMEIPESMPVNAYFNFMKGANGWDMSSGLQSGSDMHWELGQQNQPVSGTWVIPTADQFMSIFPSTPFAGNITMRDGGTSATPMDWNWGDSPQIEGTNTVRVTVPFYTVDMAEPTDRSENYRKAWRTLQANEKDPGTTHLDKYARHSYYMGGPNDGSNTQYEPDGDPEDGYASVYVISNKSEDGSRVELTSDLRNNVNIKSWGTIYGIKRVYTPEAYRMRWRALVAYEGTRNPCIYIEICRYRCESDDVLTEENYMTDYDWDHPAARLYFPVSGLGDWSGEYINFGSECQYATSDPISSDGKTSAVQIKITGNNASNAYIAIVKNIINRNFGKQIRPIVGRSTETAK